MNPLEIGCMFWVERDTIAGISAMGVRCGQLGIGGDTQITPEFINQIKADVAAHDFHLITVVASYSGEDYADLPTVQRTVEDAHRGLVFALYDVLFNVAFVAAAALAALLLPADGRSAPVVIGTALALGLGGLWYWSVTPHQDHPR